MSVGAVVSSGITLKVQLFEFVLASVAIKVTMVAPVIIVPAGGFCETTGAGSQLSVTKASPV